MVIMTHKIRIYPNKTMIKQFTELFGYSRYSYNVSLQLWNKMYIAGEKPNERKVRDKYKHEYKQDWEKSYPPNVFDNAVTHLGRGWSRYFKGLSKKPKFKSKKKAKDSFTVNRKNSTTIRIKGNRLYLPKFKYGVKMAELPRFAGEIKIATVTKRADKYWVSLSIELDEPQYLYRVSPNLPTVGVDANIGHFDISEEKHRWETPLDNSLIPLYKRVAFYQKRLSRKVKGSKKYEVTKTKLQKTYLRIQNIQDDWLNKFTTYLVYNYGKICIEDLNVRGMLSNRKYAKRISRSMFYKFRVQLQNKCAVSGNELVIADRWFPSTQTCSECGCRKEGDEKLSTSDRVYNCFECGAILDRDYNSACNLKLYAERVG